MKKFLSLCRTLKSNPWYTNVPKFSTFNYSTTRNKTVPPVETTGKTKKSLYRRISPIGDRRVSIVPVLDQWIKEGRDVRKAELQRLIKELRRYRRFTHALEVSQWMSDRRYFPLSCSDMAVRLDLISKVNGIDQVESYFNNIPEQAKDREVYGSLLNCYAQEKALEKAEDVMQKTRDLGLVMETLNYNVMLNLYCRAGNYEKLKSMMHEMDEKGIKGDRVTLIILLNVCTATYNTEGIGKILQTMESDPECVLDWNSYAIAANGYMNVACVDKALEMLKKSEGLMLTSKKSVRSTGFDFLLTQYAATGKKEEVGRLWELYKKTGKIYNNGYMSMITSLLKFDDINGAENVFEEWESSQSTYDFRIPNFLIGYYSRKGRMYKAEALINKAKAKGGKPLAHTWYFLATGYVGCDQLPKAVEAMKIAVSECQPGWNQPSMDVLIACLEYLKGNNDVEEAEEFIRSLGAKGIVSIDIQEKLLSYLKTGKSDLDANIFM